MSNSLNTRSLAVIEGIRAGLWILTALLSGTFPKTYARLAQNETRLGHDPELSLQAWLLHLRLNLPESGAGLHGTTKSGRGSHHPVSDCLTKTEKRRLRIVIQRRWFQGIKPLPRLGNDHQIIICPWKQKERPASKGEASNRAVIISVFRDSILKPVFRTSSLLRTASKASSAKRLARSSLLSNGFLRMHHPKRPNPELKGRLGKFY